MTKIIHIAVLLTLYGIVSPCFGAYQFYRTVTVDHTKVPNTNQTNFTVLLSGTYTYLKTTGNGGKIQNTVTFHGQTVPADLKFTSDIGGSTLLSWEVASYSASTGVIEVWIKIPTLTTASDFTLYMFYGDTSTSTYQGGSSGAAWDSNFSIVAHTPNGVALTALDSSANSINGTLVGGVTATTGKVDGGAAFNGSSGLLDFGNTSNITSPLTVSAWVNLTNLFNSSTISFQQQVVNKGYDGTNTQWEMATSSDDGTKMTFETFNGGVIHGVRSLSSIVTGTFQYWTGTYDGTTWRIYLNGVLDNSATGTGPISNARPVYVGAVDAVGFGSLNFFGGSIDEVRISSSVRSADWVATSYNNQSSPSTFYTIGSEQAAGAAGRRNRIIYQGRPIADAVSQQVRQASFSSVTPNSTTHGDVLVNTWCDDDKIYMITNDTQGPALSLSGSGGRNFAVVTANDALTAQTLVNDMHSYGTQTQTISGNVVGWKAGSIACISGVMYLTGSVQHAAYDADPNLNARQTATASFIIKSSDHGVTWTTNNANTKDWISSSTAAVSGARADGAAPPDVSHPWFSDDRASGPMFVIYGKDGACPGIHNCSSYVYAISVAGAGNIGYYNGGDYITLMRCLRSNLPNMLASDWTFYKGAGADGMLDANWGTVAQSTPIFTETRHVSQEVMYYNHALKRYIINNWYLPSQPYVRSPILPTGYYDFSKLTAWEILESPTPWGPWTIAQGTGYGPEGYYAPSPVTKLTSGTVQPLVFSGDFEQAGGLGIYGMNRLDMTLSPTTFVPSVVTVGGSGINNTSLIAAYDFAGNTTSLPDRSGNGHNIDASLGTLQWTAQGMFFNGTWDAAGGSGTGTTQQVSDITTALTDFTVQAVFKSVAVTNFGNIASKNSTTGFWLGRNGTTASQWGGGILDTDGTPRLFVTASDGNWHFISLSRSGTTMSVSVDGGSVSTKTVSGSALDTSRFVIGSNDVYNSATGKFTGPIAFVGLYGRALSGPETIANYAYLKTWATQRGITLP